MSDREPTLEISLDTFLELLAFLTDGIRADVEQIRGRSLLPVARAVRGSADAIDLLASQLSPVVTPERIAEQREKGWPDFHPEDFCHRCGRPNIVWYVDSPLWNAARIEEETPSGIVCPSCFVAALKAAAGIELMAWELRASPNTLERIPDALHVETAAWRDAYDNGRLPEYYAAQENVLVRAGIADTETPRA